MAKEFNPLHFPTLWPQLKKDIEAAPFGRFDAVVEEFMNEHFIDAKMLAAQKICGYKMALAALSRLRASRVEWGKEIFILAPKRSTP